MASITTTVEVEIDEVWNDLYEKDQIEFISEKCSEISSKDLAKIVAENVFLCDLMDAYTSDDINEWTEDNIMGGFYLDVPETEEKAILVLEKCFKHDIDSATQNFYKKSRELFMEAFFNTIANEFTCSEQVEMDRQAINYLQEFIDAKKNSLPR